MKKSNDIFRNEEYDSWMRRVFDDLIDCEKYLISKYLIDKNDEVLEGGTGSGRILFNLEKLGYKNLEGFDFIEESINFAKRTAQKINSNVTFRVGDASDLDIYKDESFRYLIYLQQIICFSQYSKIEDILNECYRLLKENGVLLLSTLYYEGRVFNPFLSFLLLIIRKINKEPHCKQSLPWLVLNNKFNWKFFYRDQAQNYWFRKDEIKTLLTKSGFKIMEISTTNEILKKRKKESGMLYITCTKKK